MDWDESRIIELYFDGEAQFNGSSGAWIARLASDHEKQAIGTCGDSANNSLMIILRSQGLIKTGMYKIRFLPDINTGVQFSSTLVVVTS